MLVRSNKSSGELTVFAGVKHVYERSACVPIEDPINGLEIDNIQSQITRQSYNDYAHEYALLEWDEITCRRTERNTRKPFISVLQNESLLSKPILIVGSGTGRDAFFLARTLCSQIEEIPKIVGIDYASEMVEIASNKVARMLEANSLTADVQFHYIDITKLNVKMNEPVFGSVFAETALSHLSMHDLDISLDNIRRVMINGGVALLGFRYKKRGDSSVYSTNGDIGQRFYLRLNRIELYSLLKRHQLTPITTLKITQHYDKRRPSFMELIVRKDHD
jgi:SAM-dependent methyltransferase